jgi:hypothetical protein
MCKKSIQFFVTYVEKSKKKEDAKISVELFYIYIFSVSLSESALVVS